jgi:arylsulfatase A-like enzyme
LKPNIIFLVVDSLRSDRFYGKEKSSFTPTLDKLRGEGVYFCQNISSADGTILSLNSIFNGVFPSVTGTREIKLHLKNQNYLSSLIDEDYSIYSVMPKLTEFSPLLNISSKTYSYFQGPPAESLFDGVGEKILEILNSPMKSPWFFYIHLMDLHWPLIVPKKFDDERFGKDKYDRIVSSIDYYLKKFFDMLNLEETLIIITSDHGQPIPFDEKDNTSFEPDLKLGLKVGKKIMPKFSHKFGASIFNKTREIIKNKRLHVANQNLTEYEIRSRLPPFIQSLFDENIRTPLLFSGYNMESLIIKQQTRNIDIFPTIFDLLGFNHSKKIQGTSLLPLIRGDECKENPCYMHTIPHEKLSDNDQVGIRTSKYKYFRHARNSSLNIHLYDLTLDTLENKNIYQENLEKIHEMEKFMDKFSNFTTDEVTDNDVADTEEEAKIREELKKLGYL